MAKCTNWNAIIQKFSSKLSSWKARLLSVGGRLSLIKSLLGNLPTFYMSIYLMPVSICKKLESLRNKFFIGGDPDDEKMTWFKWKRSLASKKDGVSNVALRDLFFPRLIVSSKKVLISFPYAIARLWSLDASAGFSAASVCSLVHSHILDTDNEVTRWNRNIPIKVNVFLWKLKLNKLSSRVNLDRRCIEVGSTLCPSRLDDFETVNHSFFNCGMAKDLWSLLAKWWEMDIPGMFGTIKWKAKNENENCFMRMFDKRNGNKGTDTPYLP
nr:RNA-directed DNA polymerase, eukaryota, reverse transcriptase zinc-binding domain protein [Tanacetum cinerariifolium]